MRVFASFFVFLKLKRDKITQVCVRLFYYLHIQQWMINPWKGQRTVAGIPFSDVGILNPEISCALSSITLSLLMRVFASFFVFLKLKRDKITQVCVRLFYYLHIQQWMINPWKGQRTVAGIPFSDVGILNPEISCALSSITLSLLMRVFAIFLVFLKLKKDENTQVCVRLFYYLHIQQWMRNHWKGQRTVAVIPFSDVGILNSEISCALLSRHLVDSCRLAHNFSAAWSMGSKESGLILVLLYHVPALIPLPSVNHVHTEQSPYISVALTKTIITFEKCIIRREPLSPVKGLWHVRNLACVIVLRLLNRRPIATRQHFVNCLQEDRYCNWKYTALPFNSIQKTLFPLKNKQINTCEKIQTAQNIQIMSIMLKPHCITCIAICSLITKQTNA